MTVEFIKIKASALSLSQRSPVHGVGINDAWYTTKSKIDGKQIKCPVYSRWVSMLMRCYSVKYQEKYPTYIDCTVCDEWLTFSKFAEWFEVNNVEGWDLDKDIKAKGNKTYSPDTCLFVPHCINNLLLYGSAKRGCCPVGVSFKKENGKHQSLVRIDGKNKHLGYYDTLDEACEAYKIAKNIEIKRKCEQYPEFAKYLINHLL